MPISCHFRDCKVLLVASLTHESGAITRTVTFTFTVNSLEQAEALLEVPRVPCVNVSL